MRVHWLLREPERFRQHSGLPNTPVDPTSSSERLEALHCPNIRRLSLGFNAATLSRDPRPPRDSRHGGCFGIGVYEVIRCCPYREPRTHCAE